MLPPFQTALPVIQTLEDAGYEAFFVGGSIRDSLLGRPVHDVDIATSAKPEEVKALFKQTVDVGIEHGTVLVLYGRRQYEVTTFRTESEYKDYRRPESVEYVDSLLLDLKRRDFTMNAIAMDKTGKLIDPFSGKEAIRDKRIETVGSPEERFREDALRMMRAVRFMSQLGFEIENGTKRAIRVYAHLLKYIAVERITQEFIKLLEGVRPYEALAFLCETRLLSYLPGLEKMEMRLMPALNSALNELTESQLWVYLIKAVEPDDENAFLRKWKLPNLKRKAILRTLGFVRKRTARPWDTVMLYDAGKKTAVDAETVFCALRREDWREHTPAIEKVFREMPITDRSQLAVDGKMLMDFFSKKGGPWLKEMLREIETAVLTGKVDNQWDAIRGWLACKHPQEKKF
ncbi:CCA tRNA nucleotidyltransferase [Weizmannia acidilactici]|uniref:CCA tRNA nucleotidyltransferase n=1 Tax=Weizmannia acidilactici TaxID=2607726 RepID=UPI00124D3129|nr:CCA tRNA nucleotidyltransferase [Weizmannia acidilactici]GER73748.1 CCA-adding enzyme [Weizmannia acidilactici]